MPTSEEHMSYLDLLDKVNENLRVLRNITQTTINLNEEITPVASTILSKLDSIEEVMPDITSSISSGQLGEAPVKNAVDADTLIVPGLYFCTDTTVALHYPSNIPYFVRVFRSGLYINQIAAARSGAATFTRQSANNGASWDGWQPVDYRSTSRRSVYISKDGSDNNTGLTADSPVLTVNAALRIAMGLNTSGTLFFCFGPGDWGDVTIYGTVFSAGTIIVTNYAGDIATSDPGNMPHFGTLTLREGAFNIGNVEADHLSIQGSQILNQYYFIVGRVYMNRGAYLYLANPCKIKYVSGQTGACFEAAYNSVLLFNSSIELEAGLENQIFLYAHRGTTIYMYTGFSYTGTFSGTKYKFLSDIAVAFASGKSLDNLPGTGGSGVCLLNGVSSYIQPLARTLSISTPTGDDVARAHNCIYRGDNLTSKYTLVELSTKMTNGDFSDLYIGDYITLPFTYNNTTKNINWRIAHFNYWKYQGYKDSGSGNTIGMCDKDHICFIPDTALFTSKFNPEDDTTGAVRGSYLWQLLNNTTDSQSWTNKSGTVVTSTDASVYNALNASNCFNNHILRHSIWLSSAVNMTGASAAGSGLVGTTNTNTWTDEYVMLCSEPMVYGTTVWSSSARDVDGRKSQLALFRLAPDWINGASARFNWWLGAVVSSTGFADASYYGSASYGRATSVSGVRPLVLFA